MTICYIIKNKVIKYIILSIKIKKENKKIMYKLGKVLKFNNEKWGFIDYARE